MATVGDLKTKISLDSAQFERSMSSVNRELKGLKQEQKAVTSSGTGFARGLTELRGKSDVLNRTLDLQKNQVNELKRRYEESKRETGENSRATENANIAYQKAKAEMNKTENALRNVTAEIERQSNPWTVLSGRMDETGRKMQDVGGKMSSVGKSMTTRVTLPIVGLGAAALKVGMDFEEGMSKVQAISGATGDDLEALKSQAREMGATTRFSATEAASGMEFLAMAGFETNEIMGAMPGLLDLAASSNMDLGRAADLASNVMSGFNMEASQTGDIADVLAKGASTANTSVEQLGNAMEVVAPVASMLDVELESVTAAVGRMSDSGIQGEKAGRMLRQGMLRLADPTGKAADLIEELDVNVFDSQGNMKDLDSVVGELSKGLKGMDADAQAAALSTLFGSESTAGWSALLQVGQKDLKDYTKELQNSEGAAKNMAETMEDNAKGAMREFKSASEEAGIAISEHLLPTVTDAIEYGTDLVRKFGELEDSTQKNIIKFAGFAAAVGPAALVLGNMTTAVGGLVRMGGSLAGILGKASGKGLIGRIGMLGMAGPGGLAVAGVGALGIGIYELIKHSKNLNEVSWDTIETMQEEVSATDDLIARFEELRNKNQLTNDEVLRYMDIMTDLEGAKSEETISRLTAEQERLLEKSGFTNEEMEEFLKLNDDVIDKAPDTAKAISEEGNAYAENLEALKELNEERRKQMLVDAESALLDKLKEEKGLLNDQKELVSEIKSLDEDISQNREDRKAIMQEVQIEEEKLKDIQAELLELDGQSGQKAVEKRMELQRQEEQQQIIVEEVKNEQRELDAVYDRLVKKYDKANDSLEVTREDIAEVENLKYKYEQLILSQVDLTSEKGRGLDTIKEELAKVDELIAEKKRELDSNSGNTQELQEQINKLNTQKGQLQDAQGELRNINELAEGTIYKDIEVSTNPTVNQINEMLGKPINKTVSIMQKVKDVIPPRLTPLDGYAAGTNDNPGGMALVGGVA